MNNIKSACFTGHRPKDLNGYDPNDNYILLEASRGVCIDLIENKGVVNFYSGMAMGYDMWMARIILALKRDLYPHIRLICAIPHKNQWEAWTRSPETVYEWLRIYEEADQIDYVSKEPFTQWCLHVRNEYMVNNSKYVIAGWNGKTEKSGTYNCIKYARKKEKEIIIISPKDGETRWDS